MSCNSRRGWAAAGCALLLGTVGFADEMTPEVERLSEVKPDRSVRFAAPRRLEAGKKFVGDGRLYPSPVLHDLNGDGQPDLLVGDLPGFVTMAPRLAPAAFGAEVPVKDSKGEKLKFSNW